MDRVFTPNQPDHREFRLTGGGTDAVILIHGIVGSPGQFRFMANELHHEGFDCFGLLLPGHGGSGRDFYSTKYGEWQEYLVNALKSYVNRYNNVYIIGHSLGGLLCLNAVSQGNLAGIVLINAPLSFKISAKQISLSFKVLFSSPKKDNELISAYRAANSITGGKLYEYPLWIRQFVHLIRYMNKTKHMLKDVKAKVLIVQSGKDESVAHKSAFLLKKGLVNCKTELLILPHSYHGYFPDMDKRHLIEKIIHFIKD